MKIIKVKCNCCDAWNNCRNMNHRGDCTTGNGEGVKKNESCPWQDESGVIAQKECPEYTR